MFDYREYKKVFDTYIDVYTHQILYIKDLILQSLSKFGDIALYTCNKNILNLIYHNLYIDNSGLKWHIGELNGSTTSSVMTDVATVNIRLTIPLYGIIQIGSLITSCYSRKYLRKYLIHTLITFFNANPEYLVYLEHKHLSWILMKGL